jgi:multicomponent Na+:H+ antiporter subunit D
VIEPWGTLFALMVCFLWPLTTLYSHGYLKATKSKHRNRFHACFALAIFSVLGVAFSGNLITLFIFYELLTLATYPLITHNQTPEAIRAGRIYLAYLLGTSFLLFMPAIIYTAQAASTFSFLPSGILEGNITPFAAGILLLVYAYGIGKCALMPLHRWLPEAMVAPAPVSALLHAVAVVKGGVFAFIKIAVYVFGAEFLFQIAATHWLGIICSLTVILGSIQALRTNHIKTLLAYSTISQLATILMLATMATAPALQAAAILLITHALGKITLFFVAGAIYATTHFTTIEQCQGLARRMPYTFAALLIAAMTMIGMPPTLGLLSKWMMFSAALDSMNIWICFTLFVSTLLNAFYFSRWVFICCKKPEPEKLVRRQDAPWSMRAVVLISAAACVILFFYPYPVLLLARQFSVL